MISYRIETSCKHTGAYQGVSIADSKGEAVAFCTEPWRSESVHVVYAIHSGLPPRMCAVFVAGRCVSPLFNDFHR